MIVVVVACLFAYKPNTTDCGCKIQLILRSTILQRIIYLSLFLSLNIVLWHINI